MTNRNVSEGVADLLADGLFRDANMALSKTFGEGRVHVAENVAQRLIAPRVDGTLEQTHKLPQCGIGV